MLQDGESSVRDLILHHVAPGLGVLVALSMFASPLSAVLSIKRAKHLGAFNPLPLVAIIANCTSWMVYGCLKADPYVIAANEPGLLLGFFMSLTCYGFADTRVRDSMTAALLFFTFLITSTCIFMSLGLPLHDNKVQLAGYLAVVVLLIFYAAPLSVLVKVLATRNSAALHWPLSVMSCVNGSLWVAYGLAVDDIFIYGPNAVGAALGVVQLLLVCVFPAVKDAEGADDPLLPQQEDGHSA